MKIKELLDNSIKHSRKLVAADKKGHLVLSRSKEAVAWCLYGAAIKCYIPNEIPSGFQDYKNNICIELSNYSQVVKKMTEYIRNKYQKSLSIFSDTAPFCDIQEMLQTLDV